MAVRVCHHYLLNKVVEFALLPTKVKDRLCPHSSLSSTPSTPLSYPPKQ